MPRVSVEIQTTQLPGGWMWRFVVPTDIAPQDPHAAALDGWTGPFSSEALAHDHARRALEHVVREHIQATRRPASRAPAPSVPQTHPPPRSAVVISKGVVWVAEGGDHFWRKYPREDVEIMGDVWRPEGERHWVWTVQCDGAEIARGKEDGLQPGKTSASRAMLNLSASLRRGPE